MEFNYNGYSYFIERYENEPDIYYYKRCWIITKSNPKNIEEYDKIEKLSRLWVNTNFLGCKYEKNTMEQIFKLTV